MSKMKLTSILEGILSEVNLTFKDEMVGHSHGQSDMSLKAYSGSKVVGQLDYSEYEGSPAIKMVEVGSEFKRQGIGTQLIKKLQSMYPNKEIDLGMLTDDGAALMKTINRVFITNKTYEKLKSKLDKTKSDISRIMADVERGNRSEINKLNDLHDESYELENKLNGISKGKWIIK